MFRVLLGLAILIAAAALLFKFPGGKPAPGEDERNRAFTESMTGATLVGNSTRSNREGVFGPERYRIDGVTHVSGDTWIFRARVKDLPVPIPLSVKWAGDTPVITLTDLAIPGIGTYTARVLLYRGQYAGTWSGQNGGGQLFGRIVREPAR